MKTITYNKLVRDKIPEIITASGKTAMTETLSNEDYIKMLDEKLIEEVREYQESKDVEELADVLEVIYALAKTKGISSIELDHICKQKADRRGAFENKIFLKEVIEE